MKKIILTIDNFYERDKPVFIQYRIKQTDGSIYCSNTINAENNTIELSLPNNSTFIQKYGEGSELLLTIWTGDEDITKTHNMLNSFVVKLDKDIIQEIYTILLKKEDVFFYTKDDINLKTGEITKELPIESNIVNEFYGDIIFPQKKYKIYKLLDGEKVSFDNLVFLKEGNYEEDIVIVTNDNINTKITLNINVVAEKKDKNEIALEKIEYNYCFWNPLYFRNVKPRIPIVILKSNNLKILNIDIYINNKYTYSISEELDEQFLDLDISDASEGINTIELKFTLEDTDKRKIEISNKKEIIITKNIKAELGVEYNSDTANYTINLSAEQESLKDVVNILWRVTYNSFVMQNILNVSGSDEKITTDIVFEKMTNSDTNSIDIELKQIGTYYVEAYLINKYGTFDKLKTEINSNKTTNDTGEYSVGDKIAFNVISKNNKTPVYEAYVINQEGFSKLGVFNMNTMFDNVYGSEITAELNNCVYVVKIGKTVKLFKVGESYNIHILYNPSYSTDTIIEYLLKDFEGNELDKGTMKYGDKGIMYCVTEKDKHGLIKLGNKFKRI
jgi:hypothetical protein